MDMLDKQIKSYLEKEAANLATKGRFQETPTAEEFYQFINDQIQGVHLERMVQYLKENPEAQSLVAQVRSLIAEREGADWKSPPSEWREEAKSLFRKPMSIECPYCKKSITPFKKPLKAQNLYNLLWLALSAAAFLCSFIFHRYFFQCLALALFFGIKWAIDQKSTKTQILIYKALKDGKTEALTRDLHRSYDTVQHDD